MCGILAYFDPQGVSKPRLEQSLKAIRAIRHRGPDGEGVTLINVKTGEFYNLFTDETPSGNFINRIDLQKAHELEFHLILGHRRLSIIDLSVNAHQPMYHSNGNWIIFNGEIYNYIELRDELKVLGHSFKTDSDTEVIHAAFAQWKESCFERFNGMFTILIYNAADRYLIIANDRFGVKPLYYYQNGKELILASEIKQFYQYEITLSSNKKYLKDFLNDGYQDYDQQTCLNEVQRFEHASYCELDLKRILPNIAYTRYYQFNYQQQKINDNDAISEYERLFNDSVKLRLRSDVPVGFACSGGLDSSYILYNASYIHSQKNLTTFSAVFPGMEGDESYFIDIIERDIKLNHLRVNPMDLFTPANFEKHVTAIEFPPQTTSFFSQWSVYNLVHQNKIKVLMIGQGGDEILAGYHHHFYRYCRSLIMRGKIRSYLTNLRAFAELKKMDVKKLHALVLNDVKLIIKLKAGLAIFSSKIEEKWNRADDLLAILKLDLMETALPTYLRADDRDSMFFSVESRHPFLDYRLVDFCMSLPDDLKIRNGWQKWLMRQSDNKLPHEIRYRKDKKGFTTPQVAWLEAYKDVFESYLRYIPDDLRNTKSNDLFRKYALGIWFKIYGK